MLSASDCERLLGTQTLLDQLGRVDERATLRGLRLDMMCNIETLLGASQLIADAGHGELLGVIRSDVIERLADGDLRVRDAALHCAVASAFSDLLDDETRAELSLPWALGVILQDED